MRVVLVLFYLAVSASAEERTKDFQLHQAVRLADVVTVKEHLENGVRVDDKGHADNYKALFEAASFAKCKEGSKQKILQALIDAGAHVNAKHNHPHRDGSTALIEASVRGHAEAVKKLLAAGAEIHHKHKGNGEYNALMEAADRGRHKVVRLLLAAGADVVSEEGSIALLQACNRRGEPNTEVVKALLAAGAHPDAMHAGFAYTPLIEAAQVGAIDALELLLAAGAEVNAHHNDWGYTALMRASEMGFADVVRLLLEMDANPNMVDHAKKGEPGGGATALMKACMTRKDPHHRAGGSGLKEQQKHAEIVKLLLDADADVNIKTNRGSTALMWASMDGLVDVVKLLIEAGAEVDAKHGKHGYTAMIRAAEMGRTEVVTVLLKAGADPNIVENSGLTALLGAKKANSDDGSHSNVIKLLNLRNEL